MIPSDEQKY